MTTPEDRFKQTNILVKQLGYGHTALIHLYITKPVAENILQWFRARVITEAEAFSRLRQALGTIKMLDPQVGLDLNDEFAALYHASRIHHPNVAEMLPGQNDHFRKEWFEIEGLPGGTLEQYIEAVRAGDQFDHAPPVAFGWHMVHQLCEALLAFQFGVCTTVAPVASWPMFYHGDATAANFLFRKPSLAANAASFPGYPDIVLCDLGEAKEVGQCANSNNFCHRQYEDVRSMLNAIVELFSIRADSQHIMFAQELQAHIQALRRLEVLSGCRNKNADLGLYLIELSLGAKTWRWITYRLSRPFEALESKAVAYFDRDIISDARLRRFWVKLRDGQIDDSYDPQDDDDMRQIQA